jgi:thymidylate synthase (FAD)
MQVTLHHHTPLVICSDAIRTCWQSFDKSDNGGEVDRALIDRVGNKFKHASTLEHIVYNFYVAGISRALLQELARHRMASLSVKSTRYTLKELKEEPPFTIDNKERAEKYLVMTGVEIVDEMSIRALDNLRIVLVEGISNDRAKYCLPESYKTELTWTINARSLQNFISLRSDKAALWEIRDLANMVYATLPEEHRYLFESSLKEQDS